MISDMADLMACWATLLDADDTDAGGTMLLYDVHYTLPSAMLGHSADASPIFDGLCIADRTSSKLTAREDTAGPDHGDGGGGAAEGCPLRLPSGVLVGLRATSENASFATRADPRAAETLCRMLGGLVQPRAGIARGIARTQLVHSQPTFERGSLWANLTVYAACRQTGRLPALPDVWELCRRVGMSAAVIGERSAESMPGWAQRSMNVATIHGNDRLRVSIVRALLARPDALIVDRVGADLPRRFRMDL